MIRDLFTKMYKYFLRGYDEYTLEVQKKIKYLFIFCSAGLVIYLGLIILRIFAEANIYLLAGDFFLLLFLLSALYYIKRKRILKAASTISFVPISIMFYHVIENTYLGLPITLDSLFASLAFLIFGILFLGLFAIRIRQLVIYSVIALISLSIHYAVMVHDTFNGTVNEVNITHFLSAVMGLGISTLAGTLIINLSHVLIHIAETAKRRSEEKYYSLFSNMMDGFAYLKVEKDLEKKHDKLILIEANRALKKMMNINTQIENTEATEILKTLESDDFDILNKLIRVANQNEELKEEYHFEPLDMWLNLYAFSPRKSYVVVLVRDVTHEKENTEALIKRDKIFMALGHSAGILIETYSLQKSLPTILTEIGEATQVSRTYIFENRFIEHKGLCMNQLYEWTADGISSQLNNSDLQELPYDIASPTLRDKLSKGDIFYGDIKNMTQDEKDFLEPQGIKSILIVPVFVEQQWWGFVGLDECEENRKWSNAEIEALKLTADIIGAAISRLEMEHTLREAKEKAEESDKLKGAFLANISHEVRTPMNAIVGFSEMITDPGIDEEEKSEYVKLIKQSSNNLLNLINDIIDLAKIESGQLDIHYREYNINELLRELKEKYLNEIQDNDESSININLHIPDKSSLRFIYTDYYWLRQIISNLLDNAVKFTQEGKVDIGYHVAGQKYIRFYVKDTGIGIASHNHELIFEQFRQSDNSYTREYGGTGLGLTIVKKIIESMNGYIWVESMPGKGSVFSVMLPLVIPDDVKPIHEKPRYTIEFKYIINHWQNKNILVIEKNEENFHFIKALLEQDNNHRIKMTGDQKEALNYLENKKPDIIILDTELMGENSQSLARDINRKYPNIPIIASSNFISSSDIKRIFEMGFDDYLMKPLDPVHFLRKLEKFQ